MTGSLLDGSQSAVVDNLLCMIQWYIYMSVFGPQLCPSFCHGESDGQVTVHLLTACEGGRSAVEYATISHSLRTGRTFEYEYSGPAPLRPS